MAITSLLDDLLPASLIGAELEAGADGVSAGVDLLGSDLLDVSLGLGALDSVLGIVDGLVDSGLGTGLDLLDTGSGLLDDTLV